MTEAETLEVYKIVKRTVRSKHGPCCKLVRYAVLVCGVARDDLVQDIIADYLQYGKKHNPELSKLTTYINRFISMRLQVYVAKAQRQKRIPRAEALSLDTLADDCGDTMWFKESPVYEDSERLWDMMPEIIDSKKN